MADSENPLHKTQAIVKPHTVHIAGDLERKFDPKTDAWTFTQRCSICRRVLVKQEVTEEQVRGNAQVHHWLAGYFVAVARDGGGAWPTDIDARIANPCFAPKPQNK
jgi:hypothetical protein